MEKNICPYCKYNNRINNIYCTQCGSNLNLYRQVGPRLVMLHGDRHEAIFNINTGVNSIGRNDNNTIVLNDKQISKQHAAVIFENNEYWIKDTESKNGVFLNGRRISQQERLYHGCLIKLGSTILRFETTPRI